MLKRYIMLFVLVMLMVKTNAQSSGKFYYCKDRKVELKESDTRLFITIMDVNDEAGNMRLLNKIKADPNFHLPVRDLRAIPGKYILLVKNDGSSIDKAGVLNYYKTDPAVLSAAFVFDDPEGSFQVATNVVCLKAKPGLDLETVKAIARPFNYLSIRQNAHAANQFYITLPKESKGSILTANALYETGNFQYAEPSFIRVIKPQSDSSCNPALSDTYYNEQWGLYNDGGCTYYQSGYRWADINICNAWSVTHGSSSIKVAVLDDGVDMGHTDLSGASATGWTIPSPGAYPTIGSYPGAPSNLDKHGTPCAGIIRAEINNAAGIGGVASYTTLIPVRWAYYTPIFPGWFTQDTDWEDAIDWCTYTAEADVLSASWGGPSAWSIVDDAIHRAVTDGRGGKGCVMVVSTGNANNSNISWPSSNSETIAVGAMSMCNERKNPGSCDGENWWGSNYGSGASGTGNNIVSVVAPGVKIPTTDITGSGGYNSGDYELTFNGTSSACPHVSGVAALLLSIQPCLSWKEVREYIERSADKISTYSYSTWQTNGYWNDEVGHGRLNAGHAVDLAINQYKQYKHETGGKVYTSADSIYAGDSITTVVPYGHYVVEGTADVTFQAATLIDLKPGFEAWGMSHFTATLTGLYAVTACAISFKQTPSDDNTIVDGTVKGSVNTFLSGVNIYPNPVNDNLNISLTLADRSEVSFIVSNLLGQRVLQALGREMDKGKHTEAISTSSLTPGIYLLSVKTSNGEHQFRFIKE